MAGGYQVGISSETRAFKQGIDSGIIEPLEDAQDELLKLGKSKGPEQLERAMRDAQGETKDLKKETERAADAIEKEYKRAYREAKDASEDGTGKMKAGAQEVTQELGQNLGEAVSSIRGDMSDLGQVGQDTLGGLAATLAGTGPAGIAGAAALAAGAVGLGLVTASLQEQEEAAERLRERLSGVYQEAAEEGRNYVNEAQVVAEMNSLIFDPERVGEWKQLQEDAHKLGLDRSTVLAAQAGSLTDQEKVQASIVDLMEKEAQKRQELNLGGGSEAQTYGNELLDLRNRWRDVNTATLEAKDNAEAALAVTSERLLAAARDAGTASEEVDEFGNKLLTLPDETQIVIDAETKLAHQNVDRFKGDVDGIPKQVSTKLLVNSDLRGLDEANRAFDALQRRVNRGIDVKFNNTGRMTWE